MTEENLTKINKIAADLRTMQELVKQFKEHEKCFFKFRDGCDMAAPECFYEIIKDLAKQELERLKKEFKEAN